MKNPIIYLILLLLFSSTNILLAQTKEIIAYYHGNYSDENIGHEKYIESIGLFDKITVLNYAFAIPKLDESGKLCP